MLMNIKPHTPKNKNKIKTFNSVSMTQGAPSIQQQQYKISHAVRQGKTQSAELVSIKPNSYITGFGTMRSEI